MYSRLLDTSSQKELSIFWKKYALKRHIRLLTITSQASSFIYVPAFFVLIYSSLLSSAPSFFLTTYLAPCISSLQPRWPHSHSYLPPSLPPHPHLPKTLITNQMSPSMHCQQSPSMHCQQSTARDIQAVSMMRLRGRVNFILGLRLIPSVLGMWRICGF